MVVRGAGGMACLVGEAVESGVDVLVAVESEGERGYWSDGGG